MNTPTSTLAPATEQPKVFVGICTGLSKAYANHYMVAALKNLDWTNMEIHWAITHFGDTASDVYIENLKQLMDTVKWNCNIHFHTTHLKPNEYEHVRLEDTNNKETKIVHCYDPVVRNLRLLRGKFLDGDCTYFLEVGGDNPPPRNSVKRLMKLDADAAFGTCYQRPERDLIDSRGNPLVWCYSWHPKDLNKYGLEPELQEQFKLAYVNCAFLMPLRARKDWRRLKYLRNCASGTGLVLIKRRVLERVGWRMPPSRYFSEDLYFCHQCNLHGFSTVVDLRFHVPHMHDNGEVF